MSVLIILVVMVVVVSFVSGIREAARRRSVVRVSPGRANVVTGSPSRVSYKYRRRDLFSGAELRFLKVLDMVFNGRYRVFSKVHLADLVDPIGFGFTRLFSFRHVSQRHVDYVVCDLNDYSVVCAIELDDRSHLYRVKSDKALNDVFSTAGIPLLRFPVQSFYDLADVKKRFDFVFQKNA